MWIALDCNIYTNPKTLALAEVLNLEVDTIVGKLGRLWSWAKQSGNESGDISYLPDEEIAAIMRWKKKPEILVCSLFSMGFIDITEEGRFLHDWTELNGNLMSKMRYDRERKSQENPRKIRGNSTE